MIIIMQFIWYQMGGVFVIGIVLLKFGVGFLLFGQVVMDEVVNILYIVIGNDGFGNLIGIVLIGGVGVFIKLLLIGIVNGIVLFDSGGKVLMMQLLVLIVGLMNYLGIWNVLINILNFLSGMGIKGVFYKVFVVGLLVFDGMLNWNVGDFFIFDGMMWDKIDGLVEVVLFVVGCIGVIVLLVVDISDSGVMGCVLF